MLTARLHVGGLCLDDLPVPEPGPDEVRVRVRVRVRAAGVCGTELHFTDGLYAPSKVPMTLGHEAAGTVYMVVPAACLVRLPDELSYDDAAPLCCAGTTALHALSEADVAAGEVVVVLGAGGVGLATVQEARRRGARVVCVSRDAGRRAAAARLGAQAAVAPQDLPATIEELSRGQGADVVLELIGVRETLKLAIGVLGRRGRLVLVGYSSDLLTVSPLSLVVSEQRVVASVGSTYDECVQAVALGAAGELQVPVDTVLPLREVEVALDRLRAGDVTGRLVLTP